MNHEKVWTLPEVKDLLGRNDEMVKRSLVQIYNKQTELEQARYETREKNNVGFNGVDAEFGTAMALRVKEGKFMSPKMIAASRKMMMKYANQLVKIANKQI